MYKKILVALLIIGSYSPLLQSSLAEQRCGIAVAREQIETIRKIFTCNDEWFAFESVEDSCYRNVLSLTQLSAASCAYFIEKNLPMNSIMLNRECMREILASRYIYKGPQVASAYMLYYGYVNEANKLLRLIDNFEYCLVRTREFDGPEVSPSRLLYLEALHNMDGNILTAKIEEMKKYCVVSEGSINCLHKFLTFLVSYGDIESTKTPPVDKIPIVYVNGLLLEAASAGNVDMVNFLRRKGASLSYKCGNKTSLTRAIDGGHSNIVQMICDDPEQKKLLNEYIAYMTPLGHAIEAKSEAVVQVLLDNGADPRIPCLEVKQKETPLEKATWALGNAALSRDEASLKAIVALLQEAEKRYAL